MQKTSGFQTTLVDGGLDLITPKVAIDPGTCSDGYNYEVAITKGLRRREGYERFDGGSSPSFYRVFKLKLSNNFTSTFPVGQSVIMQNGPYGDLFYDATVVNCILQAATGEFPFGSTDLYIVFATPESADAQPRVLPVGGPSLWTIRNPDGVTANARYIYGYQPDASGVDTVAADIAARVTAYSATRTDIQPVPGSGTVNGLFWFKDKLYATRDYFTISVDTGTAEPNPGDYLYQGTFGSETAGGYVVKVVTTAGSWSSGGLATGAIMLRDVVGTWANGAVKNHNAADATVANYIGTTVPQAAGLYVANGTRGDTPADQSWQHIDLSWTVNYKAGQDEFLSLNTSLQNIPIEDQIQTTQWRTATACIATASWDAFPAGAPTTQIPLRINEDPPDGDTTYVRHTWTTSAPMGTFSITAFGFTDADIPPGSYVTGLELQVTKRVFRTGFLSAVKMVDDGFAWLALGNDSGQQFGDSTTAWPNSAVEPDNANYTTTTYGGKQELFGYTNVTPDKITSSDFGVKLGARAVSSTGAPGSSTARITRVRARAHYLPQTSKIYFWDGTTAVVADVVKAYQQSGDIGLMTAQGVLYLTAVGTNRRILANEQIRTYPVTPGVAPDGGAADGSSLIALTSTRAEKNVMDWTALITDTTQKEKDVRTKYQHIVHNFYASSGLESLFIVSGGGPAAFYDGTNFARILTGYTQTAEKPRHVVAHQSRLFLGYQSGTVQYSDSTSPLSFDGTLPANSRAAEVGFGAPITGLYSLNGDALAIFTRDNVQMIQGNVNDAPYQSMIQPRIGAIEYTCQSAGSFMFTSFKGITTLEAVRDYGDFKPSTHSAIVWPYLRRRVQTSSYFESQPQGVVNSLSVKNKSQYRLFFSDGDVLFATFLEEGDAPRYTKHYYTDTNGDRIVWDVLCAGTESTGRDRLFGYYNNLSGYVYELDRGTSDDLASIDADFTLSVDSQRIPYQEKEYMDIHVHGLAQDYAQFTVTRAANYDAFTLDGKQIVMTFGSQTVAPSGEELPYFASDTLQRQGRAITLNFRSSSATFYPHCIQAISLNIAPLQEKRS